jgi:hypothetical protein
VAGALADLERLAKCELEESDLDIPGLVRCGGRLSAIMLARALISKQEGTRCRRLSGASAPGWLMEALRTAETTLDLYFKGTGGGDSVAWLRSELSTMYAPYAEAA